MRITTKYENIFISVLIIIAIVTLVLSFYVDWIDDNYSEIIKVQFVVLLTGISFLKVIDWKKKVK